MKMTLKRLGLSKLIHLFTGLGLPALLTILFFNELNPLPDYLLITSGSTAKGYITRATESSDLVESDVGVSGIKYSYDYVYRFMVPGGKSVVGVGTESGRLPVYLNKISLPGHPVEVEYVSTNPEVNRVKGMNSNLKTVPQLIRRKLLALLLIAIVWSIGVWWVMRVR